jgi:hypothetical protein
VETSLVPALWKKWLKEEYYEMIKSKPFYLWEDILMEEKIIKCFHLDDPLWVIPSKCGEVHHKSTLKYWGHIVTNKATRTDKNFAFLFDPNGERINQITHATFKMLTLKMKHEYIKEVSEQYINGLIEDIPYLSKFQARRLVKCLVDDSPHLENYRSDMTKFKDSRYIIIDMED